ncbi:MAG: hypothetical protein FJ098_11095, partial [Deltaproteobacteria bacterium]|nr:hypothetical protein [Deltaproteobacteria bacterium]
ASPENEALLLEAASLNCGYAMAFLDYSPDTASWAAAIYRKGRTYARRAVHEVLPGLDAALETSDLEAVRRELQAVGREDLKLVYWLGMCWGGRINATKSITDVADLPLVEALMQRALELDEGFFFAGAHLLFGMMYAGRTEAVGGDPARGRTHYERALELTGGRFLLGKVHYALNYAVSVQDPGLFIRLLEEVLAADPAEIDDDENRLVNQVSRDLATRLLDEVPLRFPDYRPAAAEEEEDEGAEDLEDLDLEDD